MTFLYYIYTCLFDFVSISMQRHVVLDSLRPPAVMWCLRGSMCVMDSPAPLPLYGLVDVGMGHWDRHRFQKRLRTQERTFTQIFNSLMGTGNYSATSNNMKLVYTGRWWVGCCIWYSEDRPLFAVLNVTAHPSTASVPTVVLLYNDPLLCSFNVPIKGLISNV